MPDGTPVDAFTLTNLGGTRVRVLELGGIVQSVWTADRHGLLANIVLGYRDLAGYLGDTAYVGALIGRYAGRIAAGRVTIGGSDHLLSTNDGANTLHGGKRGFDKAIWRGCIGADGARLHLTHVSPNGDQGFPGRLAVQATFELSDDGLEIAFDATTSAATVINLTHHGYWNLSGRGTVRDHWLSVDADQILAVDRAMIPTGEFPPVAGTAIDLRAPRRLGDIIDATGGIDHTFVLRGAARLSDPASGRSVEVRTSEPGLTVYTANQFTPGGVHGRYGGVALETEHFPGSPNQPGVPSTMLRPGETFRSKTMFRFSAWTGHDMPSESRLSTGR